MTDSKDQAQSLFLNALEIASDSERETYVAAECGDDRDLRREVEELLDHAKRLGGFLDPGKDGSPLTVDQVISEKPGTQIGPYKLLQRIGEGGFGVVYMAEQHKPVRRKVALKIIKPGMDTKEVIARFEAERQALALMDHPNIAKVLDAGATDSGRPYFVMELVKGVPITEFCDTNKLSTRDRLGLFAAVCRAVQHAHQKGVIHRDLKPTNVMVTLHDNKPMPVIIDFGVSKAIGRELTEKTLFTAYGQMVGTPAYMSPEQAQMRRMDIDTRSDIYSLGVMLYELLTGSTPLDAAQLRGTAYSEMQRLIQEEEAPKPSTRLSTLGNAVSKIAQARGTDPRRLGQFVRGDLDWIALKALEKERNRRYETANGLANDIERFLNDETVEACPPSFTYQMRKFMRRHRGLVTTGAVIAGVVLLGIIGTTIGLVRATQAAHRAQNAFEAADHERKRASRLAEDKQVEAQRAVDAQQEAERKHKEAKAVVELLAEMIGSANPDELEGPQYTVLELLEDFSAKLDDRLIDQPAVEATVRLMISAVYHRFRTNYAEGVANAERAYELRRQLYGATHELTIRAEQAKALHMIFMRTSHNQGKAILQKIIDLSPSFMEQDHEFTLHTKNGAILLSGEESVVRFRDLLAEAESKLGNNHPLTCGIRQNYASRLKKYEYYDQAELQLRQAIAAIEESLGKDAPIAVAFRTNLAGVFIERGDDERAREILLLNLELAQKHLGEAHRDTIFVVLRLMQIYDRQSKIQLADDLFADYSARLRNATNRHALTAAYWLSVNSTALDVLTQTPTSDKWVELAAEIYLNWLAEGNRVPVIFGRDVGSRIAVAARAKNRLKVALQVARAAWEAYGVDNATPNLASDLVATLRLNGDNHAVGQFLAEHLTTKSALFQHLDRNTDQKLDPIELATLLGARFVAETDTDGDRRVSTEDAGELLWKFISVLDQNEDGFVDPSEYIPAFLGSQFAALDSNDDGYLSDHEAPGRLLANCDNDQDGRVSETEFVTRRSSFGPSSPTTLTPEEKFAESDLDADGRVTKKEADDMFWKSIAEFDTNGDDAVDREELVAGLREKSLASRRRLFAQADAHGNGDGQLSADEVGKRWKEYKRFDTNGDGFLTEDEFLKSTARKNTVHKE